ncbi:hypothetical protein E2C01_043222 [Portunus trituberculatus]|uniref:Uncharacterized protein n=1 Tax=Portunus trituberculatus TaxID=210409 RepID=A0A5B7FWQ6_PORTR|nr:hypothetical protein [Portunus trituberculatus]
MASERLLCEQEVAMEVVRTNIDNNLFLGSGPRVASLYTSAWRAGGKFRVAGDFTGWVARKI